MLLHVNCCLVSAQSIAVLGTASQCEVDLSARALQLSAFIMFLLQIYASVIGAMVEADLPVLCPCRRSNLQACFLQAQAVHSLL